MSLSLRRLASDHASLRRSGLPPRYLFPPNQETSILPDDLTQLTILLTGAQDTPYAQGLWQLQLRMPSDYPQEPPRATFMTRLWHPNVEESTGAVCLETLKRDWDPKLTLRDILVTISCLLIHPNPDSALNSAAGSLLQDNYRAFAEQARLMTSIHARIPAHLRHAVDAARRRGEEEDRSSDRAEKEATPAALKLNSHPASLLLQRIPSTHPQPYALSPIRQPVDSQSYELSEDEEDHDPCKENDPSQSPSPVIESPRSPRKNVLGKRPLSELPTPTDLEEGMTESEKNIAVNQDSQSCAASSFGPPKKSPRLAVTLAVANISSRMREGTVDELCTPGPRVNNVPSGADDEKENLEAIDTESVSEMTKIPIRGSISDTAVIRPTLRKVSNLGWTKARAQPRIGLRRL
ncbi:hypothetical protein GJ744_005438 [Endocarpon pusillum]|uniref:Ubiquitin-conjugating enzyme E2 2 n=1 Tax=Endocarpon pusillum TaxID=364733 RepID=A0A8H7A7K9_9EURO|nr:hypothetical protein GJ744_005438 [Endocarpon pusillum]